jgi:hypothetical protein
LQIYRFCAFEVRQIKVKGMLSAAHSASRRMDLPPGAGKVVRAGP